MTKKAFVFRMNPVTNRIRVFLFGIFVAFLGLIDPAKALLSAAQALDEHYEK